MQILVIFVSNIIVNILKKFGKKWELKSEETYSYPLNFERS